MKRLLLTGAAGGMARAIRPKLAGLAEIIRLSDREAISDAEAGVEVVQADLADRDAVFRMVEGVDAIIHLGGVATEAPFEPILQGNIIGMYNLYEAARAHGHPRIVFASSNHTIGFYRQDERIDATAPIRPDGLYGVSKCYGEALARMYFEKFGQQTAILRIGSCFPEPVNVRMLATWLSADDFLRFCIRAFTVPRLGCPIVYGASDNPISWWDNSASDWLGWHPQDSSKPWQAALEAGPQPAADDPLAIYHGGSFTAEKILGT